jgi:hypothetical protein
MAKRNDRPHALPAWIFGSVFTLFLLGVFLFGPNALPEFKQRILAFVAALLAGFFGYFLTGTLGVDAHAELPWLGKTAIKGGGGLALFVVVLAWWSSPSAPVRSTDGEAGSAAATPAVNLKPVYTYAPDRFRTSMQYPADSISRSEYQLEQDVLSPGGADDFLKVDKVEFDNADKIAKITLTLRNVTRGPLALDLREDFFRLEDNAGQAGHLELPQLPSGTLSPGDGRNVVLYYRVKGWHVKHGAREAILTVEGLLPLVRGSWRWTLAAAAA